MNYEGRMKLWQGMIEKGWFRPPSPTEFNVLQGPGRTPDGNPIRMVFGEDKAVLQEKVALSPEERLKERRNAKWVAIDEAPYGQVRIEGDGLAFDHPVCKTSVTGPPAPMEAKPKRTRTTKGKGKE